MVRRNSFVVSLVTASVLGCVLAPVAAAAFSASQVTLPASPTFATFNQSEPNSIAVHGTTTGYAPGEEVDIDCYSLDDGEALALEANVALAPNGSFQVDAANLAKLGGRVCRLRAVPAGSAPAGAEAAPFAGPLVATGQKGVQTVSSGPNSGRPSGFAVESLALTAGTVARPIGRCGATGFLLDAAGEKTTTTFACGARLWRFDDYDEPGNSTRAQIQVDGADAWDTSTVFEVYGGNPEHFPAVTYASSQDPLSGDTVTAEGESFVTCTPTLCTPVGVRDARTIESLEGGHVALVTDRFSSTDGEPHAIDLLPESVQNFGPGASGSGAAIAYRFPGELGYSTHALGDEVAFAPGAPATVWIDVEGSADGDHSTGRGAIVFGQPASPARFNYLTSESGFQAHEAATVPASGSAELRTAYVQAYTQAEVESLVARVEDSFAPPPVVPAPPQPPSPGPAQVRPKVKGTKVKLNERKGTALLLATVNGPGQVVLSGKGIVTARVRSVGAGTVKLPVRPRGSALRSLARTGKATLRAKLVFHAAGGATARSTTKLTLRKS